MTDRNQILQQIKHSVLDTNPSARIILFGSYARRDNNEESDIDLLILIEKDKVTYDDKSKITFPLFMLGVKIGIPINPIIYSKDFWETKHKVTPFYENVNTEGLTL